MIELLGPKLLYRSSQARRRKTMKPLRHILYTEVFILYVYRLKYCGGRQLAQNQIVSCICAVSMVR